MAVSIQAASAVVNAAAFAFMQLTGKTQALQVGALLLPARRRPGGSAVVRMQRSGVEMPPGGRAAMPRASCSMTWPLA